MKQPRRSLLWLSMLLLATFVLSIFVGRYPKPYWTPPHLLQQDPLASRVVLWLRLPRIIAACLLGITLSAAGAVMQMIFRNPLVEPGFLGVSQGAAFGAALSIVLLGASPLMRQIFATVFACLGLAFSYFVARRFRYGTWTLRLILAGIAVSALYAAGVGLFKYIADPLTQLPEIVFWMLGGLWNINWRHTLSILPITLTTLVIVLLMRWRLNVLALDDDIALSLGIRPKRERLVLLVATVVATAAVISIAGVVGWIGLIIPHLARRLLGTNAQYAIPGSILLGGTFALICDTIARTALVGEIPLGILTSLFGAMMFIGMMIKPTMKYKA